MNFPTFSIFSVLQRLTLSFCWLSVCQAATAGEVLLSESNAGVVRRYATDCLVWTRQADFAAGSYGGEALQQTLGLAKDAAGRDYMAGQWTGVRVLRFTADGTLPGVIGREGVEYSGNPHTLATGPGGLLYLSTAFGTGAGWIYQINPTSGSSTLHIGSTHLTKSKFLAVI